MGNLVFTQVKMIKFQEGLETVFIYSQTSIYQSCTCSEKHCYMKNFVVSRFR